MDPGKIFQIITNSTLLATRLLTGSGSGPLEFTQPQYCAVLREDAKLAAQVLSVTAVHKEGLTVRYSITGGNRDGLFTIDQHTGLITLAAALDYEVYDKHELIVSGEAGGHAVHTVVQVKVADVNDNPPFFVKQDPKVTVIEEDDTHLPKTLLKVEARDKDDLDHQGLLYTVRGDGVDGFKPSDAYFTINSLTGELVQQRALDRDPPYGKAIWRVRVQVRDGQALWSRPRDKRQTHSSNFRKQVHPNIHINRKRKTNKSGIEKRYDKTITGDHNTQGIKGEKVNLKKKRNVFGRKRTKKFRERNNRGKSFIGHPDFVSLNRKNVKNEITSQFTTENYSSVLHKTHMEPFIKVEEDEKTIKTNLSSRKDEKLHQMIDSKERKRIGLISATEVNGKVHSDRKKYYKREVVDVLSPREMFLRSVLDRKKLPPSRNRKEKVKSLRISGYDVSNSLILAKCSKESLDLKSEEKERNEAKKSHLQEHFRKKGRKKRDVDPSESPQDQLYEFGNFGLDVGCDDRDYLFNSKRNVTVDPSDPWANVDLSAYGSGGRIGRVHVVETIVTLYVKDINDNPPVFPNGTMFGEVQENGPIDLSVAVVSAWDADDADEGYNAKITYSIEKNVVHEKTGEAIFNVDPRTGLVSTAVCCLDRETTPEYYIQVVATDGGGLRGSGTVIVRLADVNDNSPRLSKKMWKVNVDETWGLGPPDNSTLLEISVNDRDTANYFFYRVVEESGWGWAHFDIKSVGTMGHLYARQTLDYEDEAQRRGFKFMIQVTDRGRGGWIDQKHLDSAWVQVRLRDVNDNPPMFQRPHVQVTVKEDVPPGSLLATLSAMDPDMESKQGVEYRVQGGWDSLEVDDVGGVSLWRSLDRDAPNGALGIAQVMAVDNGNPPLTSTATLTITVTDVNDCPPRLLSPTVFHKTEGTPPTFLGLLTATDRDVWALGHGPPFSFALAPSNSPAISALFDVRFDAHLDSGRGGAHLWTKDALDRELYRELSVEITLKDAGGLAQTQIVTVIVDDVNDNPMKPASKTVYLWKTQSGSSEAPLGRVYVDDPDDWDIGDKVFRWLGQPHPLFSLNTRDGAIFASSQVREGRYELQFLVSDTVWGQKDVSANVTVSVRLLSQEALAHSTPITVSPTTPERLTAQWHPMKGGGGLGRLIEGVKRVIGETVSSVEIVSIYDVSDGGKTSALSSSSSSSSPSSSSSSSSSSSIRSSAAAASSSSSPSSSSSSESSSSSLSSSPHSDKSSEDLAASIYKSPLSASDSKPSSSSLSSSSSNSSSSPSTCVWISVKEREGYFMDPVKLQGILGLHSQQLEKLTNLTVVIESPTSVQSHKRKRGRDKHSGFEGTLPGLDGTSPTAADPLDPSSAASRASTSLPLQVVDTNSTSLVTPRLSRATQCSQQEPETCTTTSCLNGGRCIRTMDGNRCVCPSGSWGFQCKILSRTFHGDGFAWIRPLPPCIPTLISLRVLTRKESALLLYAGSLVPSSRKPYSPLSPLLVLQVAQGKVQMIVEGGAESLKVQVGILVNDGNWHVVHAKIDDKGISLMVDLCGIGRDGDDLSNDTDLHCAKRASWRNPEDAELWFNGAPIQVGGLANTVPSSKDQGWKGTHISHPLDGCLSLIVINRQLIDLGEPAFTSGSSAGCSAQEASCSYGHGACGIRGTCVGGLNMPECLCDPGWSGSKCDTPTIPVSFGPNSYMKIALSFTSASRIISAQVRIRTRGTSSGLVLYLGSKISKYNFLLKLERGIACASVTRQRLFARSVCVEGRPLGDGLWHTVKAEVHGHNIIVSVDDGDGWRKNDSLPSLSPVKRNDNEVGQQEMEDVNDRSASFKVDENDDVTVGGLPEFVGKKLIKVYDDLRDICLDDLRLFGHAVPLSPTANDTTWGHVTTYERVESGCAYKDSCSNITCSSPLTCISNWGRPTCGCQEGRQLIGRSCEDVDECMWRPCLHGGTCYNMRPGFLCVCGPTYTGEYCQWNNYSNSLHSTAGILAIAAITLSLLILVVVGVVIFLRLKHVWFARKDDAGAQVDSEDNVNGITIEKVTTIEAKGPGVRRKGRGIEGGGGGGGVGTDETKMESTQEPHPESLNIRLSQKDINLEPNYGNGRAAAALLDGKTSGTRGDTALANDDLRAYAYEGDGSSAGSLTSALSGLRVGPSEEGTISPLVPAFLDVMDLLKNLPDASMTMPPFPQQLTETTSRQKEGASVPTMTGTLKEPLSENTPEGKSAFRTPSVKSLKSPKPKTETEEISTIC